MGFFIFLGFSGYYRTVVNLLFGWRNWFEKHSLNVWIVIHLCLIKIVWQNVIGVH